MSFTKLKLETKRYGVPRKSAGSVTRRIASEILLWYMYEVCMRKKEEVFGSNKASGEERHDRNICRKMHLSRLTQHSLQLWPS